MAHDITRVRRRISPTASRLHLPAPLDRTPGARRSATGTGKADSKPSPAEVAGDKQPLANGFFCDIIAARIEVGLPMNSAASRWIRRLARFAALTLEDQRVLE